MSPVLDKEAWAVDALSLSWEGLEGFAFHPTPLITSVVNKILSHDCRKTYSDCPRMAQHVVLRSSEPVIPDTPLPTQPVQSSSPAI